MKKLIAIVALVLGACHGSNETHFQAENSSDGEVGNTMSAADIDASNANSATMENDANIENGSVSVRPEPDSNAN